MARKWSNLTLPGALHFVTGNCVNRSQMRHKLGGGDARFE